MPRSLHMVVAKWGLCGVAKHHVAPDRREEDSIVGFHPFR
jgi:hypothetical protein